MLKLPYKTFLSVYALIAWVVLLAPAAFSQSSSLGQSEWQMPEQSSNQQCQSNLATSQSGSPGVQGFNQVPGLTNNVGNLNNANSSYSQVGSAPNLGQSPWQTPNTAGNQYQANVQTNGQQGQSPGSTLGLSPWQQTQNSFQANTSQNPNAQQNPDYYYGQINQNQNNPYAVNTGQYQGQASATYQGQANYSSQPNNQWANNLPPASSIPGQQTQPNQQSQNGGLKKALGDITKTATRAAGLGMGVAAPFAGMYMMTRAMSSSVPGYGVPYTPYGYGYPGMAMPMSYMSPNNYAMMNMAPMYSSALSGLSSFMMH